MTGNPPDKLGPHPRELYTPRPADMPESAIRELEEEYESKVRVRACAHELMDDDAVAALLAAESYRGHERGAARFERDDEAACVLCMEETPVHQMFMLDCQHMHCQECFDGALHRALHTLPFRPMRCCAGPLPREQVVLMGGLADDPAARFHYLARMEELETAGADRLYCHDAECNMYIPCGLRGPRAGTCGKCFFRTCKRCGQKSHFGTCDAAVLAALDVASADEEAFNEYAHEQGWVRCPLCKVMIQKTEGCNHLVCECGQNFCYLCGEVLDVEDEGLPHHCADVPAEQPERGRPWLR
ncbi:hypothetical protein GGR52DRAFT_576477 [Hypoxylon sp. FL1284]|nr:hypothetical protein GGR52DRAFT_576477 [Hypoxylon sp. FL1284]